MVTITHRLGTILFILQIEDEHVCDFYNSGDAFERHTCRWLTPCMSAGIFPYLSSIIFELFSSSHYPATLGVCISWFLQNLKPKMCWRLCLAAQVCVYRCPRDQKAIHFRVGPLTFAKPKPALLMNIQNREDNEQTCLFFYKPRPRDSPRDPWPPPNYFIFFWLVGICNLSMWGRRVYMLKNVLLWCKLSDEQTNGEVKLHQDISDNAGHATFCREGSVPSCTLYLLD